MILIKYRFYISLTFNVMNYENLMTNHLLINVLSFNKV